MNYKIEQKDNKINIELILDTEKVCQVNKEPTRTFIFKGKVLSSDEFKSLHIGKRIQILRVENKMTQFELSEKLSIKRSSLSITESNGKTLTLQTLKELCVVFECKSSLLLDF